MHKNKHANQAKYVLDVRYEPDTTTVHLGDLADNLRFLADELTRERLRKAIVEYVAEGLAEGPWPSFRVDIDPELIDELRTRIEALRAEDDE